MLKHTVIFDANVLYPASLRSILMYLATTGLFKARWTLEIHEEWIKNLLLKRQDLTRAQLEFQRNLMIKVIPDSLVDDYQWMIDKLELPDKDDRHVLAAAIKVNAEIIVTVNLKDFPSHVLKQYNCIAQHPDDFIVDLLAEYSEKILPIFKRDRCHYLKPPYDQTEYLDLLKRQGLIGTSDVLDGVLNLI